MKINSGRRSFCTTFDRTIELSSDQTAMSGIDFLGMRPGLIESTETHGNWPKLTTCHELRKSKQFIRKNIYGYTVEQGYT